MADFVTRNRPDWDELEQLLARGRRSVGRLAPEELNRLDVLYRRVAVHLAQVRTRTRDERLAAYLNQLAAAAHTLIYLPPRQGILKRIALFAVLGFAECVARNWRMHAISAGLLVAGAVLAYHAASNDVLAAYALALPGDARLPGTPPERLLQYLRQGREQESGRKSFFASFLFSHNLKVGLLSMGLGVLAGVPTVILMLYNGMMVGTFLSLYIKAGLGLEFCRLDLAARHHRAVGDRALRRHGTAVSSGGDQPRTADASRGARRRGNRSGTDGRRHRRHARSGGVHREFRAAEPPDNERTLRLRRPDGTLLDGLFRARVPMANGTRRSVAGRGGGKSDLKSKAKRKKRKSKGTVYCVRRS